MNIAIVGDLTPNNYHLLDQKLNELIEEKQCYLFNVLCGGPLRNEKPSPTLGSLWAKNNGAPVHYIFEPTPAKLFKEADYIVFLYDGNQQTKNLIMQYKMTGKHGSVINI